MAHGAGDAGPVCVVGAGPCGLAAAIALGQAGIPALVFDRSCVVSSVVGYPTFMTFFSTAERLEIGGLPFVSPYDKPTRAEALKYYRKVVDTYDLQIAYDETVVSIELESAHGDAKPGGEAS